MLLSIFTAHIVFDKWKKKNTLPPSLAVEKHWRRWKGKFIPKLPLLQLSLKRRNTYFQYQLYWERETVIPSRGIQLNPFCGPRNTWWNRSHTLHSQALLYQTPVSQQHTFSISKISSVLAFPKDSTTCPTLFSLSLCGGKTQPGSVSLSENIKQWMNAS